MCGDSGFFTTRNRSDGGRSAAREVALCSFAKRLRSEGERALPATWRSARGGATSLRRTNPSVSQSVVRDLEILAKAALVYFVGEVGREPIRVLLLENARGRREAACRRLRLLPHTDAHARDDARRIDLASTARRDDARRGGGGGGGGRDASRTRSNDVTRARGEGRAAGLEPTLAAVQPSRAESGGRCPPLRLFIGRQRTTRC